MIKLAGGGGGGSGSPLIAFQNSRASAVFGLGGPNQVAISGFVLQWPLKFANITVYPYAADAAGLYDIGIYNKAGKLIANIGPQAIALGEPTFPTLQGSQTIEPDIYLFAFTGNADVAQLSEDAQALTWVFNGNVAASVGGTLPAAIGAVAVAPSFYAATFVLS